MKLLIIVPAYNEAENILRVVDEIREKVPQYDYIVVNDGSSDHTPDLCRENHVMMLDLPTNLGLTGAFQAGCRYAYEKGYDAVIQIDGDGQHDPVHIPEMAEIMEEKDCDIVLASRFLKGKRSLTMRTVGNYVLNCAVRMATRKKITDSTSGMRMYGKRILKMMAFDLNSSPEPDTLAYLLRSGAKYMECPVVMRERIAGESYLSPWKSIKYMAHHTLNIMLVQWFRKRGDF